MLGFMYLVIHGRLNVYVLSHACSDTDPCTRAVFICSGGADPSRCRGITSYSDPCSPFDLRANQQVFCFLVDLQPEGL